MGRVCVRVYGGEEGEDREDGSGICREMEEGERRGYGHWEMARRREKGKEGQRLAKRTHTAVLNAKAKH